MNLVKFWTIIAMILMAFVVGATGVTMLVGEDLYVFLTLTYAVFGAVTAAASIAVACAYLCYRITRSQNWAGLVFLLTFGYWVTVLYPYLEKLKEMLR